MKILNKKLKPEDFVKYVQGISLPFWRKVDKLVFHHTSSREDLWHGSASMLHYFNLYQSRGWKSGPHIFIAPDGIWLFTPITKQGTHAGPAGNKNSIGIEVVGRYHDGPPTSDTLCKYIAVVTEALMEKFGLDWSRIFNHQEFDKENFCTNRINAEWLKQNLQKHQDFIEQKKACVEAEKLNNNL